MCFVKKHSDKRKVDRGESFMDSAAKKLKRFALFVELLKEFCVIELDQWVRWKLETKFGPVYISISRESDGYSYEELKP